MNDEPNQATNPDESLAQAMPDPAGPPKPVEKEDDVLRALAVVGVVLVAGGGLLLPLTASTGATSGATRSAKIQWEQREAEVRQAMAQDDASLPANANQDSSQAGTGDRGGE